jgi:cell pole-organizing protein PopZ
MTATNAPSFPAPADSAPLAAEQKAHEPSMDDILASIRRIISDDDALPLSRRARAAVKPPVEEKPEISEAQAPAAAASSQKMAQAAPARSSDAFFGLGHRLGREPEASPEPAQPATPVAAPPEPAAVERPAPQAAAPKLPPLKFRDLALKNFSARATPEPQAASAEAEAVSVASEVVSDEPPAAPMEPLALRPSLAEVAAPAEPIKASVVSLAPRLASFSEARLKITPLNFRTPVFRAPPRPADPVEAPPQAEPAVEQVAAVFSEPASTFSEPAAPLAEAVEAPIVPAPTHPSAERLAPIQAEAALAEPRETQAFRDEPSARAPEPRRAEAVDRGLLSPVTGAKINASFEALAESLMTRDPDLVERVAREMLRPMLKSWLEDNLPIVVERLVRAEIERVARGR